MRRPVLLLAIAALLVAQGPVYADDLLFGGFSSYLDSLRVQAGIPGLTAAVIGGDAILWEGAFGKRSVEQAQPTRTDAPFHLDGLTEVFTAELVLRCVEEGRLSLDDRIGQYTADAVDGNATLRELLTHTSGSTDGPAFAYHPERLAPLASAIAACRGTSYRSEIRDLATRLAMTDTVPGPDALSVVPPADGFTRSDIDKYAAVLGRLATPVPVDGNGHTTPSLYTATTLTPSAGLISTVDDYAKFDFALRQGIPADARDAGRRVAGAPRQERPAAAARSGLVRPDLQRRDDRLAVRAGRERVVVARAHGAGPRVDAHPDGEQRWPREGLRAGAGRRDGVAIRQGVSVAVRPLGPGRCVSAFWRSRCCWFPRRARGRPNGR